ncbi:hypothetical protein C3941_00135 [Kaistia algarum]|uniref:hypothetical protein n=1 Tax=Kaistia algarum TaxID=2083279 RepID=UPI000CE75178|nr:hypothetical protein [Kaistia algarum]MCX5513375.1 hypothetical protein [Kaistia algarum]PPE81176.1 hypothetical protein C3941_00135 [Kaistia algarum]
MPKPSQIDTAAIAHAKRFDVTIFLGTGRYHTASRDTLERARAIAPEITAEVANGRKAMIYAVAEGRSVFVPDSYRPSNEGDQIMPALNPKPAPAARKGRAKAAVAPEEAAQPVQPIAEPAKAPNAASGGRRAAAEAAQRGELPTPPDFTAETHKRFRPKLARLVEMAKAGDIAALRAEPINPVSSSPKAMERYRDLAVTALEVRAARGAA